MKYVTCPDCKGEKTIKEVQSVRLVKVDDATAAGADSVIELPCKRCRGKGEVPDISCEDRRRAINIIDTWAVKAMAGMGEVPDTDELIEAVAIAIADEREGVQNLVEAAGRILEQDVPVKINRNNEWEPDWREGEMERMVELHHAHAPFVKGKEEWHHCIAMGCDERGHVAAKFDP
jgi:hypothetical protein